jgi:hypothetical protein
MPHAKPLFCALLGQNDGIGLQRTQQGVIELVVDIVSDKHREANAKQSLTQMFNGDGKATGAYTYLGLPVWHASSGNGEKSVCLFYTLAGSTAQLVAIGEHKTSKSYAIEWGRQAGDFKAGRLISL